MSLKDKNIYTNLSGLIDSKIVSLSTRRGLQLLKETYHLKLH